MTRQLRTFVPHKGTLVPHRQSGQNRLCVHLLAEAAGISYADMKLRLYPIAMETPLSLELAKDLIGRIQRNA